MPIHMSPHMSTYEATLMCVKLSRHMFHTHAWTTKELERYERYTDPIAIGTNTAECGPSSRILYRLYIGIADGMSITRV